MLPSAPSRSKEPLSEGSSAMEHHHLFIKTLTKPFQSIVSLQVTNAERSDDERKQCRALNYRFEWRRI